jgi:hypothetical protein
MDQVRIRLEGYVDSWLRPVDGASLSLFRVALTPALLFEAWVHLDRLHEWGNGNTLYMSFAGIFDQLGLGYRVTAQTAGFLGFHLGLLALFTIAAVCFGLGLGARLGAGACAAVLVYFVSLDVSFYNEYTLLLILLLAVCAVVPTDRYYALHPTAANDGSRSLPRIAPAWVRGTFWLVYLAKGLGLIFVGLFSHHQWKYIWVAFILAAPLLLAPSIHAARGRLRQVSIASAGLLAMFHLRDPLHEFVGPYGYLMVLVLILCFPPDWPETLRGICYRRYST